MTAPLASSSSSVGHRETPAPTLRRAAEQFETMFLAQMLRDFTAGTVSPASSGEVGAFATMLQDEYAKLIGRSGGIGLTDAILREMLKVQEIR